MKPTYRNRDGEVISSGEWAASFNNRRVARTDVGEFVVSTVWTGLEDEGGNIFESIIFWNGTAKVQERTATELEALIWHMSFVQSVSSALAEVDDVDL